MTDDYRSPWSAVRPAPTEAGDIGPETLAELERQLMIDEQWIWRGDRSFRWWGAPVPLDVSTSPPLLIGDEEALVRITARSCLARAISAGNDDGIYQLLSAMNANASFASFVFDADARTIDAITTAWLRPDLAWMKWLVATAVVLTYSEALAKSFEVVAATGGELPVEDHPVHGQRNDLDDLAADLADDIVITRGQEPNGFIGEEFEEAAALVRDMGYAATADGVGLSIEAPFISSTPALLQAALGFSDGLTSLIQVIAVPHPGYGQGLLALVRLPLPPDGPMDVPVLANGLNRAEAIEPTGFPQWGGWCSAKDAPDAPTDLVHAGFVPNVSARPGLLTNVALWSLVRAQWARERLVSDHYDDSGG